MSTITIPPDFQSTDFENLSPLLEHVVFEEDVKWLCILADLVHQNISNNSYSIGQLAEEMATSDRHLRRKMKKMTGLTPSEYLNIVRLKHAQKLLKERKYKTLRQVAYAVGYKDVGSFRLKYKRQFGTKPKL